MRIFKPGSSLTGPLVVAAALLAAPNTGLAQQVLEDGFDAHGFHLAAYDGDIRDPYSVLRPGRMHQWEVYASVLAEYAESPLSYVSGPPGADNQPTPVLDNLMAANFAAGLALHDRVRVDVAMPLYIMSSGVDGAAGGTGIGDMRASAMIGLLRPFHEQAGGAGLGLVPWIDIPLGDDQIYLGNSGVAGGFALAATYELEKLTFSGHFGMQFNPTVSLYNMQGADKLVAGVATGLRLGQSMAVNLEALLSTPYLANDQKGTDLPAEAILSLRKRFDSGGHLSLGVAGGMSDGMGTAPYRAFLGGGFGHINTPAPVDGDGDGIPNAIDDCPDEPESYNGWRDSDGCPDSLGTLAISGTYKGAPHGSVKATVTGDGGARSMGPGEVLYVPDIMPGTVVTVDLVAGGCLAGSAEVEAYEGQREISIPLDRSLEGSIQFEVNTLQDQQPIPGATVKIRSEESDCGASEKTLQLGDSGTGVAAVGAGDHVVVIDVPNYALYRNKITVKPGGTETVSVSLKKSKTRVTAQRIEIFEKVHFETGKAIIKPESYDLLDEVATVIQANPQIKLVEVAGHTDDHGSLQSNQTLSDDRAAAVLNYLVDKGVSSSRLQATGFGETRTIDTNETVEGRARNRRVEFNILQQDTVIMEED